MKFLVTGSSGHLGEALVRTLRATGTEVVSIDIKPGPFTDVVGTITDPAIANSCMSAVDAVLHSATLHKPHVGTHSMREFVNTNIQGTLALLEAAVAQRVGAFVFTSTTSVFGDALRPPAGQPAAWVTEEVEPIPRNIYGVTKKAAEDLCHLFHRKRGLDCIVLRTSRFFPEEDDSRAIRDAFDQDNAKANEFLFRRVDLEDVVSAHLSAAQKAPALGFGRYIISATTPFDQNDLDALRTRAPEVLAKHFPEFERVYAPRGWRMFDSIDRVYVNEAARRDLAWKPKYDFGLVLSRLLDGRDFFSPLSRKVGSKGYHRGSFSDGPYPVEE